MAVRSSGSGRGLGPSGSAVPDGRPPGTTPLPSRFVRARTASRAARDRCRCLARRPAPPQLAASRAFRTARRSRAPACAGVHRHDQRVREVTYPSARTASTLGSAAGAALARSLALVGPSATTPFTSGIDAPATAPRRANNNGSSAPNISAASTATTASGSATVAAASPSSGETATASLLASGSGRCHASSRLGCPAPACPSGLERGEWSGRPPRSRETDGSLHAGYRRFGPWTEATVDRPGPQPTPSQLALQHAHSLGTAGVGIPPVAASPSRARPGSPPGCAGDDAVGLEARCLLEPHYRDFRARTQESVHRAWRPSKRAQCSLEGPHARAPVGSAVARSSLERCAAKRRGSSGRLGHAARDARACMPEQEQGDQQAPQSGPSEGHSICPLHRVSPYKRLPRARPAPGRSWSSPCGLSQAAR